MRQTAGLLDQLDQWTWLGHALWIKRVHMHSKNNTCRSHLQIVPIIHNPEKESKEYEWENEIIFFLAKNQYAQHKQVPAILGKQQVQSNTTGSHTVGHYQLHQPCSVTGQALRGPEYRQRGTQHGKPWTVLLFAEHVPKFTGLDNQGC